MAEAMPSSEFYQDNNIFIQVCNHFSVSIDQHPYHAIELHLG